MNEHQAQGLRRQFSPRPPHVISVLARPETSGSSALVTQLVEQLALNGYRILLVESNASFSEISPLSRWNALRPLDSQVMAKQDCQVLLAPGGKAGDREITEAAKGEFDIVIYAGQYWQKAEVMIDADMVQSIVLWVDDNHEQAAFAVLKALQEASAPQEYLLVAEGAEQVAQAASKFLKMPFLVADTHDKVWHNCHGRSETSSDTLSLTPDLVRYVARILGRRDNEATITNHARNHRKQQ